jgi:hypothetical protein
MSWTVSPGMSRGINETRCFVRSRMLKRHSRRTLSDLASASNSGFPKLARHRLVFSKVNTF